MSYPPWDQQTFSFGWEPSTQTIPQCTTLNIQFNNDHGFANPVPVPPYTVNVYQGGHAPLTLQVGNLGQTGTFPWLLTLPVGPVYILTMTDSAGYTGGTSIRWFMSPGTGCTLPPSDPMPPATLRFTRTGNAQCSPVSIVVITGTAPFKLEIIPESHTQRTLHFATNEFGFILDLPEGQYFVFVVTDAIGNSHVSGVYVGGSDDSSCLTAAATMSSGMATSIYSGSAFPLPSSTVTTGASASASMISSPDNHTSTSSTRPKPGAIGGAVTGAVAISVLAIFLWWFLCRRRRQAREAAEENRPRDEGLEPEMIHTNSNMPGHNMAYSAPYQPAAIQEIQGHNVHDGGHFGRSYALPAGGVIQQSYDPYSRPTVPQGVITMHAPQAQPLSHQTVQPIAHYTTSNSDQQPSATKIFSPTTDAASPSTSKGTYGPPDGISASPLWGDRKERVVSPPIPYGVLAPSHMRAGSQYGPILSSGNEIRSWNNAASPPPRSFTGTALPPYELESQHQGSIRE